MKVQFKKDTKDIRDNRNGTFKEGKIQIMSDDLGRKYVDKGSAIDVSGEYKKKKKIKEDGEE
jgi:hypothetical protein